LKIKRSISLYYVVISLKILIKAGSKRKINESKITVPSK